MSDVRFCAMCGREEATYLALNRSFCNKTCARLFAERGRLTIDEHATPEMTQE